MDIVESLGSQSDLDPSIGIFELVGMPIHKKPAAPRPRYNGGDTPLLRRIRKAMRPEKAEEVLIEVERLYCDGKYKQAELFPLLDSILKKLGVVPADSDDVPAPTRPKQQRQRKRPAAQNEVSSGPAASKIKKPAKMKHEKEDESEDKDKNEEEEEEEVDEEEEEAATKMPSAKAEVVEQATKKQKAVKAEPSEVAKKPAAARPKRQWTNKKQKKEVGDSPQQRQAIPRHSCLAGGAGKKNKTAESEVKKGAAAEVAKKDDEKKEEKAEGLKEKAANWKADLSDDSFDPGGSSLF